MIFIQSLCTIILNIINALSIDKICIVNVLLKHIKIIDMFWLNIYIHTHKDIHVWVLSSKLLVNICHNSMQTDIWITTQVGSHYNDWLKNENPLKYKKIKECKYILFMVFLENYVILWV